MTSKLMARGELPRCCHEAAPFVHTFATARNRYVFDVNTGEILRTDAVVHELISGAGSPGPDTTAMPGQGHSPPQLAQARAEIAAARERGLLSSVRPRQVTMPHSLECIAGQLACAREQLILNLTEACNLRCAYCVFGEAYPSRRPHSARSMDWPTAQAAVDEYLRGSRCARSRAVTFYGGEPLLNADLLAQCVRHIRAQEGGANIFVALTTNGTLLNGEVARLLADEGVSITVSLDGPRSAHDRYRRAPGGAGTWDTVTANLRRLIDTYPRHAKAGLLQIQAVLGPGTDVVEVDDFFASWDLLDGNVGLRASALTEGAVGLLESLPPEQRQPRGMDRLFQRFVANLVDGAIGREPHQARFKLQRACFERELLAVHRRRRRPVADPAVMERVYVSSACIPGIRRTFVTVDGDYLPCERVPQYGQPMVIGNVRQGIDPAVVYQLHKQWVECNADECRSCWCIGMCQAGCFASAHEDGTFTPAAKRRACAGARRRTHDLLVAYCQILEQNAHALDYLAEVTVT